MINKMENGMVGFIQCLWLIENSYRNQSNKFITYKLTKIILPWEPEPIILNKSKLY